MIITPTNHVVFVLGLVLSQVNTACFFEEVKDGTKFTVFGDLDMRHFKLLKMIAKRNINQQIKKDLLKLKYIVENGRKS